MPIIISEDSDDKSRLQIRNQQIKRKSRKSRKRRGQSGNRDYVGTVHDHTCTYGCGGNLVISVTATPPPSRNEFAKPDRIRPVQSGQDQTCSVQAC